MQGDLIWAPPPRSPCASPTTSWKRRGPQEGASPTSLLSSMHCWSSLRVEVGVPGHGRPGIQEQKTARPGLRPSEDW